MTHDSIARAVRNISPLRKWGWGMLPGAIAAVLVLTPHAHAQNTPARANQAAPGSGAGTAGATGSGTFNPSADISRAVSRDTTDTAIQNNWNSIMRPPVKDNPEDKPVATPRRGRGITPGISTN
ncbi:hypothetical protein [Pandoraea sp. SD6-2]|uniref:hypothetical protein n=1 Tax=Pandoraea sp. SD6-2 TaxID=1286093 RepID=UPI00032D8EE9|nr:hypothetical protein [Pandoraea sp. SD6-2]EON12865.1 hypothetical protein C266_14617 [Pandoraea sp. SD6-2]